MKKIVLILSLLIFGLGVKAQYPPSGLKQQLKQGLALGSKDSTAFTANDSLMLTIDRNGKLLFRGNGSNAAWNVVNTNPTSGTVTSIATNNGTGINGGTITTSGTLAIDTLNISTRLFRIKGTDSLGGLIALRVKISDTANMLSTYQRILSNYSTTYALSNDVKDSIQTKLALRDTASMLSGYARTGNIPSLSGYVTTTTDQSVGGVKTFTDSNYFKNVTKYDSTAKFYKRIIINPTGLSYAQTTGVNEDFPSIYIRQDISNASTVNEHGIIDNTRFSRSGKAYNSYDAQAILSGTNNLDHYAGFQSRGSMQLTGTNLSNYYSFLSAPDLTSGTVDKLYHFINFSVTGTGAGAANEEYGFYAKPLVKGTRKYAFYSESDSSFFGNQVEALSFKKTGATNAKILLGAGSDIDTTTLLSGRWLPNRSLDTATALQARIQTKQPLGNYLTFADSLSGGYTTWLRTKKVIDSLAALTPSISAAAPISYSGGVVRADTGRAVAQLVTGGSLVKVRDSLQTNINLKLNISDTASMLSNRLKISDTLSMLDGRISSITLNNTGVLHTTPLNFTRSGGAWSGTQTLVSQSANTVFAAPNGSSGTPTFRALVAADIPSGSTSYIQNQNGSNLAAQSAKLWVSDTIRTSGRMIVGSTLGVTGAATLSSTLGVTGIGTFLSNNNGLNLGASNTTEKWIQVNFSNGNFFLGGNSTANYVYGQGDRPVQFYTNNVLRGEFTTDNSFRQVASAYHNWGSTSGSSGYGFRDNAGTMEYKNSGGAWAAFGSGGITGSGTSGQVGYWNGTSSMTGSSNLFWDNTNGRLGIGINAPSDKIHIYGAGTQLMTVQSTTSTGVGAVVTQNDANNIFQFGTTGTTRTAYGSLLANNAFNYGQVDLLVASETLVKFGVGTTIPERGRILSNGRLLWNTTTDNGVDNVQVNGSLIATTLKGTTATISGNATVAGTLGVTGATTLSDNLSVSKTTGTLVDIRATASGGTAELKLNPTLNNNYSIYTSGTTDALEFRRNGTALVTFSNVGGATLTGALSGTSASFSSTLGVTGAQTNSSSIAATKIIGNSSTPSNALGSSTYVGTGASASISGNDMAGVITLTSGTGTSGTGISERTGVTVTFASAYASAPVVVANIFSYDGSGNAIATTTLQVNPQNTTTSQFQVTIPNGTTLAASTTFRIAYHVIGR